MLLIKGMEKPKDPLEVIQEELVKRGIVIAETNNPKPSPSHEVLDQMFEEFKKKNSLQTK